jgi:hypothetical protein
VNFERFISTSSTENGAPHHSCKLATWTSRRKFSLESTRFCSTDGKHLDSTSSETSNASWRAFVKVRSMVPNWECEFLLLGTPRFTEWENANFAYRGPELEICGYGCLYVLWIYDSHTNTDILKDPFSRRWHRSALLGESEWDHTASRLSRYSVGHRHARQTQGCEVWLSDDLLQQGDSPHSAEAVPGKR